MRPARFPSLSFRDPAFGGGAVAGEPDPADPALWAWFRGDKYILEQTPPHGPYPYCCYAWGNASNATVDKTNRTNSRNLSYRTDPGIVYPPCFTRTDQLENIIGASENLTSGVSGAAWYFTGGTRDDATHYTFSALNGAIFWQTPYLWPQRTYKLTITARAVSGNTNLEIWHPDSLTGVSQPLTLTGSLADYTFSFLGKTNPLVTYSRVGIRDPNAAGFGQIEVTKWHLRDSSMSDTYLLSTGSWGPRLGTLFPGHRCVECGPYGYTRTLQNMTSDDAISLPLTIYFVTYFRYYTGWLFGTNSPDTWDCGALIDPPLNMYANTSGVRLPFNNPQPAVDNPYILTWGFQNGVTSYNRKNLEAPNSGNNLQSGASITRGFTFGGQNNLSGSDAGGMYFPEIIIYEGTRTALQEADTINYLAARYGIVV